METKKCPHCNGEIAIEARKCKHCREWLKEEHDTNYVKSNSDENNDAAVNTSPKLIKQHFMFGVSLAVLSILLGFVCELLTLKGTDNELLSGCECLVEMATLLFARKYLKNFNSEKAVNLFTWVIVITGISGVFMFIPQSSLEESDLAIAVFIMFISLAICGIVLSIMAGSAISKIPNDFVGDLKLFGQTTMYCIPVALSLALIGAIADIKPLEMLGYIFGVIPMTILIRIFIKASNMLGKKKGYIIVITTGVFFGLIFMKGILKYDFKAGKDKETYNITAMKDAIYDIDYSITIGKAFKNYRYWDNTHWNEFESKGRTIVEFTADYKETDYLIKIQFAPHVQWEEDEDGSNFTTRFVGYKNKNESEWHSFYGHDKDEIIELIYKNKKLPYLDYLDKSKYFQDSNSYEQNNTNMENSYQNSSTTEQNNLITSTSIAGIEMINKTVEEVKPYINNTFIWEKSEYGESYDVKNGDFTLLHFYIEDGKIKSVTIYEPSLITEEGLHVGSASGDLLKVYPNTTVNGIVFGDIGYQGSEYVTINGITYYWHHDTLNSDVGDPKNYDFYNDEAVSKIVNREAHIKEIEIGR